MGKTVLAIAVLSVAALTAGSASASPVGGGRFDRPWEGFAPASTELDRKSVV